MPQIDQHYNRRVWAKMELHAAAYDAREALLGLTGWKALKLGNEAGKVLGRASFGRDPIAKLTITKRNDWATLRDVRVPTEDLCRALDLLCAQKGVPGCQLHRRWQEFTDADEEAKTAHLERLAQLRVGVPPMPAVAVQRRTDKLDAIEQARSAAVLVQVARGDGGVGKTQLARAVWDDHLTDGCQVMVWIAASEISAVVSAYAQAALAARLDGVTADTDPDQAAELFRSWLSTTAMRWLIVLDGVLDPANLTGLWPPTSPTGFTLATTRRRDLRVPGATTIEVGVFTPPEASAYLRERLDTPDARPDALDGSEDLARELRYLPLALAQAAAYVERMGITCRDYLTRFTDQAASVDELFPGIDRADEYAATVATAWLLAVAAADQLPPRGLARPALELASVLDPDGIPEQVWTGPAGLAYLSKHRTPLPVEPAGATEADGRAALRNLHLFSVITHNPDPEPHLAAVVVHALVQRATRDQLHSTKRHAVSHAAANSVYEMWLEKSGFDADLLRNTTALRQTTRLKLPVPALYDVLDLAADRLGAAGQVGAARDYHATTLEIIEDMHDADDPIAMNARGKVAYWQGQAGDPLSAVTAFTRLLSDQVRVLGPDAPDTLTTRSYIAFWRGDAGDPTGAATAFEELLTDQLRILGPDHPDTLSTRSNIAFWRGRAGDPTGAATAFEELLTDQLRILGPDHPDTLSTRNNLASSRGIGGDPAGAATAFEDLLTDRLRILGPDDPDTLATRGNLASSRGRAGDPTGAATAFEELLTDQLRILGPDHRDTLLTRNNIAVWRGHAGEITSAAAALKDVLADRLRVLGPDHPDTLTTRSGIAFWQGREGDPIGAATAFEDLLADMLHVLGPDHPDTLTIRSHIAYWRSHAEDPIGAATILEELLPDQLRILGPDHPETLTTRSNLASSRGTGGDPAGAATAFEELLTDRLRILGPDHPDTLSTRRKLARWRGQADDHIGAATAFEALLTDQRRFLGPDHPETLTTGNDVTYWRKRAAGDI